MEWAQVLFFVGAGLGAWLLYRSFQNRPEMYSAENIVKSLGTLGWLALGLIVFITFCVMVLRLG